MTAPTCERWAELSDRAALGEALSTEETRFAHEHARKCVTCATEAEVYGVLAGSLAPGDAEERPLHDRDDAFASRAADRASARATTTRARLRWGAAAACALALAAALVLTLRPGPVEAPSAPPIDTGVNVVLTAGQVKSRNSSVRAGSPLAVGSELRVDQGRACLSFSGTTTACAGVNSTVRLTTSNQTQRVVDLQQGTVVCRLDSPPPGMRFSVNTPRGKVTALGTVFTVELLPSSEVAVRVHRGVVAVEPTRGGRHELRAPAAAILGDEVRRVPTEDAAWDGDRELVDVAQLWSDPTATPLDLDVSPAGAHVTLDGFSLGASPVSALVARGPHELSAEHAGYEPYRGRFVVQSEARVSLAPPLRPLAAPPEPAPRDVAPPPSAAELLAQAHKLRRSGRYAESADAYQRLRTIWPHSPEATAALLSLADLKLTLGEPASALRLFDGYLASRGPLSQEAHYGRIRALRNLGRTNEAQDATTEFVRAYPDSAQAQTLRAKTQTSRPPAKTRGFSPVSP